MTLAALNNANKLEYLVDKKPKKENAQPDPSTKIETVQITVPVRDAGQIIGVLLMSLTAENLRK